MGLIFVDVDSADNFFIMNYSQKSNYILSRNKDEITEDSLGGVKVFVLAGCKDKFTAAEVNIYYVIHFQLYC